jgi:hypothetical protein
MMLLIYDTVAKFRARRISSAIASALLILLKIDTALYNLESLSGRADLRHNRDRPFHFEYRCGSPVLAAFGRLTLVVIGVW